MAGICNTCKHFRGDAHPGDQTPHHCALQDAPLSEEDARKDCPECVPEKR